MRSSRYSPRGLYWWPVWRGWVNTWLWNRRASVTRVRDCLFVYTSGSTSSISKSDGIRGNLTCFMISPMSTESALLLSVVFVPGSVRSMTRSRCTNVFVAHLVVHQPLHDGAENLDLTMRQSQLVVGYVSEKEVCYC